MYDSGIAVNAFIQDVKSEVDIAPDITDEKYILWINTLQQMLYSEVIKEQCECSGSVTATSFDIEMKQGEGEADIRPEDVIAVFYGDRQLIKTTLLSSSIFDYCWYVNGGKVYYKTDTAETKNDNCEEIRVIYHPRPAYIEKTEDGNIIGGNIMLPPEFIDLMYSYVRAEAYKLCNENELCAKWTAEYNALLEQFKTWVSSKSPRFGM